MDKGAKIYMECIFALQNQKQISPLTFHREPLISHNSMDHSIGFQQVPHLSMMPFQNGSYNHIASIPSPFIQPYQQLPTQNHSWQPAYFDRSLDNYTSYHISLEKMSLSSPRSVENSSESRKLWHPWRQNDQMAVKRDTTKRVESNMRSANSTNDISAFKSVHVPSNDLLDTKNPEISQPKNKGSVQEKIPRPMNSFMIFAKRNRGQIYQVFPHCDNRAVSKILSETWYALEAYIKQPYIDLANDMKSKHFQLYPEFKWKSTHDVANDGNFLMGNGSSAVKNTHDQLHPVKSTWPTNLSNTNFQLAPTPAQLGISRKKKHQHNPELVNGINDPEKQNNLIDMHFHERFQILPLIDFTNYIPQDGLGSLKYIKSPGHYDSNKKRIVSKKHFKSQRAKPKSLTGQRFFGPDFNAGEANGNFGNGTNTPISADPYGSAKIRECRATFKQRKDIIMDLFDRCGIFPSEMEIDDIVCKYRHLFGTKAYLNAKVREHRQKFMHDNQPKTG